MNNTQINHFLFGSYHSSKPDEDTMLPCRVNISSRVIYINAGTKPCGSSLKLIVDEIMRNLVVEAHAAKTNINVKHYDLSLVPGLPGARFISAFNMYECISSMDFQAMFHDITSIIQFRNQTKGLDRTPTHTPLVVLIDADSYGMENANAKMFQSILERDLALAAEDANILLVIYGFMPNSFSKTFDAVGNTCQVQYLSLKWQNEWSIDSSCLNPLAIKLGYKWKLLLPKTDAEVTRRWSSLVHQLQIDHDAQESNFLSILVGYDSNQNPINLKLGESVGSHHAIIVGTSGTGKTTLLNNIILGIAERYAIDEVELYLADLKQGVEFQHFSEHPNCRAIFLGESMLDNLLGLLQDFSGKLIERGALMREAGVSNIDDYNKRFPQKSFPHLLLIIDEVHELFSGGWKQAGEFEKVLHNVVRQGRSFGIHIVLSTQTIKGANISSGIMAQMSLRVAFKLVASEIYSIFNDVKNDAPIRLEKYQFVYNNEAGVVASNVIVNSLPPRNIAETIAIANSRRKPEERLEARIVSGEPAFFNHPIESNAVTDENSLLKAEKTLTSWPRNRLGEL